MKLIAFNILSALLIIGYSMGAISFVVMLLLLGSAIVGYFQRD